MKAELRRASNELKADSSFVLYYAMKYRIRRNVARKKLGWQNTQSNKLSRLRSNYVNENNSRNINPDYINNPNYININNNNNYNADSENMENSNSTSVSDDFSSKVVINFSSYILSEQERKILSLSLDHYIPFKSDDKRVQVEFERFYSDLLSQSSSLSLYEKSNLKRIFLNTYHRYSKIKHTSEEKTILESLIKNPDIVLLKLDKGRGVVIMNRSDYIRKAERFLNGSQFEKLDNDPTKSFQAKVQRTLLSMKSQFGKDIYKRIYPSSSQPGLFFGLAKVHKLNEGCRDVDELPIRPVISNIGTSTYQISKYLAQLLSPLTKNVYCVESTKDFLSKIKDKNIESDECLVSFDVTSLFTNVPLDYTIDLILEKVYRKNLIVTKLKETQLRELLVLCTKEIHFSYNEKLYKQVDGVAMGSPLGPVLANIFMVDLEEALIPTLSDKLSLWLRYVDDTFTFIKKDEINNVNDILNNFHANINFTHVCEKYNKLAFLDVQVNRETDGSFSTGVYRKNSDTNIYINWNSYAPKEWKIGTLKGLFRRAFLVCSNKNNLDNEIRHLKTVFKNLNEYPNKVVYKTMIDVKKKIEREKSCEQDIINPDIDNQVAQETSIQEVHPYMTLPYKGLEGHNLVKKFKSQIGRFMPNKVKPRVTFKGKRVNGLFPLKDSVKIEHQSNLVYAYSPLPDESTIDYVGETNVRYGARVHEHITTDKQSAVYRHAREQDVVVSDNNFSILAKGYSNKRDRKIAEALYINDLKPRLNEQVRSYKLFLFNN